MAKKADTFINMVIALLVISAVAATTLGYVYEATKGPIAEAKRLKLEKAIAEVVPEFDRIETIMVMPTEGKDSLTFYKAFKGEELVGTAVKTYTEKGYSGRIWIIVGFTDNGKIINYAILEHKETPGLGDKMDPWFKNPEKPKRMVLDKDPAKINLTVSKDGGDIDAITAATITSRAFLDAIDRGHKTFMSNQSNGGN